jgi:hypothetical protein
VFFIFIIDFDGNPTVPIAGIQPFIAKKGAFIPNSSFGEVRRALEKLLALGDYHGPWLTPESKTSFESLIEGVECLYDSGPNSEAFASWWEQRSDVEKELWNSLRITPMDRFIEHFNDNTKDGVWKSHRTDQEAISHTTHVWEKVKDVAELMPRDRFLCRLDRGAYSVIQSLCVKHTKRNWVSESVGCGDIYCIVDPESRKKSCPQRKAETVKHGENVLLFKWRSTFYNFLVTFIVHHSTRWALYGRANSQQLLPISGEWIFK